MELNEFLVKAKINTYAKDGEGGEKRLEDGGLELNFQEGEFKYRNRYFGFDPFIGQEIVWENGKMVWGMNYYGKILSESVDIKKFLEFLKKSLLKVEKSSPFRGPKILDEGDFIYASSYNGTIEDFHGEEVIFYKKDRVYRLLFHGGLIKK